MTLISLLSSGLRWTNLKILLSVYKQTIISLLFHDLNSLNSNETTVRDKNIYPKTHKTWDVESTNINGKVVISHQSCYIAVWSRENMKMYLGSDVCETEKERVMSAGGERADGPRRKFYHTLYVYSSNFYYSFPCVYHSVACLHDVLKCDCVWLLVNYSGERNPAVKSLWDAYHRCFSYALIDMCFTRTFLCFNSS